MSNRFESDFYRYYGVPWNFRGLKKLVINPGLWYLFLFRKLQSGCTPIIKHGITLLLLHMRRKYGLDIPWTTEIGEGFYMGHPHNITINSKAKLGRNVNIGKGATIGQENRGKRKGTPVIGNNVWIGVNATIVGNISVGEDVLIAPNSFVNVDVPSHSIVVGNPGKIIPKENATEDYINRRI